MDRKTALHDEHVHAGARLVPFAGYVMPIQYRGIIEEHRAVRTSMGMFDLSHMGEFRVTGADAISAIDYLLTNDIAGLRVGQIRYTPMCYPDGGVVDDLLVYRFEDHLLLVVNASNLQKDLEWIREHVRGAVQIDDVSEETALIAMQGPRAQSFLQSVTQLALSDIPYYHFARGEVAGVSALVSRTGYTGEDGFELYVRSEEAVQLWQALWSAGEPAGLQLIGLGARDTLRLEAGYMLYGNDIDETTSPLEAGLGWTVKFGATDFVGRDVLEDQKANGLKRRMVALQMQDRAIPRPHYPVQLASQTIGELTSGTFSPTFGVGIGLGYVETGCARIGAEVSVLVRDQAHPATVVRKPMYKREG